jgi:hypothetical protein
MNRYLLSKLKRAWPWLAIAAADYFLAKQIVR